MNEYVERDKFLEAVGERNQNSCDGKLTYQQLKEMVEAFPTADAAPVVRCENCTSGIMSDDNKYIICCRLGVGMELDDFCSHGERKTT